MKFRFVHAVSVGAVLSGAIAAAVATPPSAQNNPLRVGMVAVTGGADDFLGSVEVSITNTSKKAVRLPKWQLPSDQFESKLFSISYNGQPVAYEGAMVKRGLPQAQDFAILQPGETVRRVIDLSAGYDLSKTGQYVVAFNAPLQHASTSDRVMLQQSNGLPMSVQSAPLSLWVDGLDQLGGAKVSAAAKPVGTKAVVNGVNYVGCTTSRTSSAGQAVVQARAYAENAKGYLNNGTVGPRYTTWFGAYTSSRYSTARSHFASIDSAIDQSGGQITINCGCTSSAYAYVYPNQPYQIYVCNAFWNAPLTGTDSKAGTLIHEMSHFTVVAGTDDHVYGQAGAKNLANTNPTNALDNADNHEYFAENTPFQN
ncbi:MULTISPECIES: M35 family metallo-endopeptidase [unclassified Lysobacter]|uniref:M35 family metallo-endopeptidase n=1 Tax=unclassified Lysobacter TaxID=2635362 RepID=UPI001BECE16F|nr:MULTISPECIES: M35 family metallo-endopeptidase [unclassified Lysobacter]MBT2746799.1 protease [Lysobacter sp. ISL-42]MBT2750716.1 protease [Lysobacter sp. ISL-50]MBT2779545.1 protease [Lysobacter sp. ISL-54]MBT2782887.1 protease [Lysobacter sp. ISL-52]